MATNETTTVNVTANKNASVLTKEVIDKALKAVKADVFRYTSNPYLGGVDWSSHLIKDDLVDHKMGETVKKPEEEWVWVTGYKGTDRNMQCKNNYQFEIGKKFDMPEDAMITICKSGFHFCPKLRDVFSYYDIGGGHRYFEVSALVRKKDYDGSMCDPGVYWGYGSIAINDKLAAKSIIFTRELTVNEVLECSGADFSDWTEAEKTMAMEEGISVVTTKRKVSKLVELGYSEAFAKWIINRGYFADAYAVGQQKDLSMDMKVAAILG